LALKAVRSICWSAARARDRAGRDALEVGIYDEKESGVTSFVFPTGMDSPGSSCPTTRSITPSPRSTALLFAPSHLSRYITSVRPSCSQACSALPGSRMWRSRQDSGTGPYRRRPRTSFASAPSPSESERPGTRAARRAGRSRLNADIERVRGSMSGSGTVERETCFDPRRVTEPHTCPGRCSCYVNHVCWPGCACTSCPHNAEAHVMRLRKHMRENGLAAMNQKEQS
jgi:hypothetical protein